LQTKTLKKFVEQCVRCGLCKAKCPVFNVRKPRWETASPRGKILLAKALLDKKIAKKSQSLTEFYTCTLCKSCDLTCPCQINVSDLIEEVRTRLALKKMGPLPSQSLFIQSVKKNFNPYFEAPSKRLSWIGSKHQFSQKDFDVLYFVGCTASYRLPEIASATFNLLKKANINFLVHPEERCCGSPLLRVGEKKLAKKLAEYNVKLIESLGVEKVVVSCAGCYRTLKIDYPFLLKKNLSFEVLHAAEYLNDLIKKGFLKLDKPVPLKVTYHDPCHLGKHCRVYLEPRNIIQKIPQIDFVELPLNKQNALCCGGGGGVRSAFEELALNMGKTVIREALDVGVKALISTCPFCKLNLLRASEEFKTKVMVFDLVEIFQKSVL
jgi:heterodisulfide reductase subunit D